MKFYVFFALLVPLQILSFILMFPSIDLSNAPVAVYECEIQDGTEVTIVFLDEDHPNPLIDPIYDIFRLFRWGRMKDVESFYVKDGSVLFPDDYASVSSFFQTHDLHERREVPLKDFEFLNGEMLVYVNTWNHMFSNLPIPSLTYVPMIFTPKVGCRSDVEKVLSIFK